MNPAISSYLRHTLVTLIVLLATKYKLPEAGLGEFAEGLALLVIGTVTWLAVKYAPPGLAKFLGLSAIALIAGGLSSCGMAGKLPEGISFSTFYLDASTGAKAGLTQSGGRMTGTLRIPITDESGAQSWVNLESSK